MHQVERRRLQPRGEKIVVDQHHVFEAFLPRKLCRGAEHGIVDVGADDLSVGAHPLAEQSQPSHHAAADIDGPKTATVTDLIQKTAAARLPHERLELEPFQLRDPIGQQVRR
jgi:hypothetical protein